MAGSKDSRESANTAKCQIFDEMIAGFCRSWIPLVKQHRVYLRPIGHGDDERFARNFRETWRLIGKDKSRVLTNYWRRAKMAIQPMSPLIEVLQSWSGRDDDEFALCANNGHKLRFWACGVDAMPDDMVQTLIAHELAHAYRKAIDGHNVDPTNPPTEAEREEDELQTRLTVEIEWGFDEDALSEWLIQNGDSVMRNYEARMSD